MKRPSALVVVVGILISAAGRADAAADSPSLVLRPTEGPIGTRITLVGKNCGGGADTTEIVGRVSHGDGLVGNLRVGVVSADFRLVYRIPRRSLPDGSSPGGRIGPGDRIHFDSGPPDCISNEFVVRRGSTSPSVVASGASESAETAKAQNQAVSGPARLATGLLVLVGLGLIFARFSTPGPRSGRPGGTATAASPS